MADLIDLEFFMSHDEGEDLDALAARDRQIYTDFPADVTMRQQSFPSAQVTVQHWLASRRKATTENHTESPLPGKIWQELFFLFFSAAVLFGLCSGAGIAFSFLAYSGTEPINVAAYFAVFVLLEAALFLALVGSSLCGHLLGNNILESSLLYRLTRNVFFTVFQKLTAAASRRAGSKISAETKLKWTAHSVSISQLRQQYDLLVLRPFFLLAQLFGVSFNAGVLAATLLKVIGSDLAFGWQTTLQINPESVYAAVRWISLPWSWLPATLPTLAQIEGSRLILKDGIYHLISLDLASWWPFLCLSVFCYGLLPRLILLAVGILRQQRELANLSFDQGRFRQLVHRMQTPLVSTAALFEPQTQRSSDILQDVSGQLQNGKTVAAQKNSQTDRAAQPAATTASPIIALIPDELSADCPLEALQEQIRHRFGYTLCKIVPFWTMELSEEEELASLKTAMRNHDCDDLLLLHEAWQPPIQELLTWLNLLRTTIGSKPTIIITLIGKPSAETILTPVMRQNMQVWQQKLATVNDHGLQLTELVKS